MLDAGHDITPRGQGEMAALRIVVTPLHPAAAMYPHYGRHRLILLGLGTVHGQMHGLLAPLTRDDVLEDFDVCRRVLLLSAGWLGNENLSYKQHCEQGKSQDHRG